MKLNFLQPSFLLSDMAEPRMRLNLHVCRICVQLLRDPATLPCGHNFCLQCIQDHLDRDQRKNRTCSCPQCGHKFPSRPQPIKNTTLEGDAAAAAASMQALKRPALWSCRPGPGGPSSGGRSLCERHGMPLDIYCCTDQQIICAGCDSTEHTGHTIGSVKEERRRKQEELKNMQTKTKQILQKQEKKCENMGKTLEQIQEEARETQDYCESILAGIVDSLQRHYMSVRELIRGQEEEAAAPVQMSLQTLQVKMEEMRKRDAELDHLAQTDDDVHFLQKWTPLWHLCEDDHLPPLVEVSEGPLLPFEFTKRAVDQIGKQLQELCDKEFASISQTGLSGVNNAEQDEEPKTRAEFLQYACCLSLDPTTAHEDLLISAGDKEVRLSPIKCKTPAVRYPERFSHRRQLLCREGLQAERCYYEIEVEGDKAEIALAYKGIDRRSRTKLSAFGGNANSWSLDRSTSYSVSHRADSIQLTTYPCNHRLGIYLKCKEGTLSFYEVSDSMTFLYKVEAEFTEPLYPGFWLGDKCCIRICDLRPDRL
ncbi:tripartite motif-containing protein 16-like protein [Sebastes fasciatus]|uniref:tripartite motif-containing protein 16-like protein n=1 Tax=Sebastes fasciatus TaxID=394691 RepID=UPI003D9F25AE